MACVGLLSMGEVKICVGTAVGERGGRGTDWVGGRERSTGHAVVDGRGSCNIVELMGYGWTGLKRVVVVVLWVRC